MLALLSPGPAALAAALPADDAAAPLEALAAPVGRLEAHPWLHRLAPLVGRSPRPHLAALRTLEGRDDPAVRAALSAALRDVSFPYRAEAARALGRVPHAGSIDPLLAAGRDADARVRLAAARALRRVCEAGVLDDAARSAVLAALEARWAHEPDPVVRAGLFFTVLSLGTPPAFHAAFRMAGVDPDPLVRCEALRAQKFFALESGSEETRAQTLRQLSQALARVAREPQPGVLARALRRARAARRDPRGHCPDLLVETVLGVGAFGGPGVLRRLGPLARHEAPRVRAAAVRALGEVGGRSARAAVLAAVDDPRWSVRREALDALARIGDARSVGALTSVLEHGDTLDRWHAARVLARVAGGAETLVGAFRDPYAPVRDAAARALLAQASRAAGDEPAGRWRRARDGAEEALFAALARDDALGARHAARVLAAFPGPQVTSRLAALLEEGAVPSAARAAFALGLRGEPQARAPLERAAVGESPALALAAVRALQDLPAPASAALLRGLAGGAVPSPLRAAARLASVVLERTPRRAGAP